MNPPGYAGEHVLLQGTYDGQFGGPTLVQHTTVTINTDPPKDHIIWSLFCLLYGNPFCLGWAAFVNSIKARDRRAAGDLNGARQYGSTARCLNIWSTVLVSLGVVLTIIITIVVVVQANQAISVHSSYNNNYNRNYG